MKSNEVGTFETVDQINTAVQLVRYSGLEIKYLRDENLEEELTQSTYNNEILWAGVSIESGHKYNYIRLI